MGDLIALGFDHLWAANEVLQTVQSETTLDAAFVVERTASGRCVIKSAFRAGNPDQTLWSEMVRLLFLNPSLDASIPRGGSAVFLLLKDAARNRVLRAARPYRGRILQRSASDRLKGGFTKAA